MASTADGLFGAIEAGDERTVRRILDDDPELAVSRDDQGVSALMRAVYRFDAATAAAIREGVGETDVFEAAALGDPERLEVLLDAEPALASAYSGDGFTALHFAAFFGSPDAVRVLLARGAEVDAFGRGWMTGSALHSAVSRARSDVVGVLLAAGANANVRQSAGWTPLHSAAHNGDLASVDLLLEAGADPAANNEEGRTVFDLAQEQGDEATVERIRRALQTSP
jgi:ankyrin repeat protein